MRDAHKHPRTAINRVVESLERYGQYDFRSDGGIRIERWRISRALGAYEQTLRQIPVRIEGEPPSATMIEEATVEWRAEPAEVGVKVRQRHVGKARPEARTIFDNWAAAGKPFPSSGGVYATTPNKSFAKVKELSKNPELRDAIINLKAEEDLIRFMERYIPLRFEISSALLDLLKGGDKEALSRHNAEAGMGIQVRGRRLKRKDTPGLADDLRFLLTYAAAMAVAFAAVQIAKLSPDEVWIVRVYDDRVKGAIASRSDMEVLDTTWDGTYFTVSGVAQTRQAGSDATGALSNSATERKLLGSSVTEQVLKDYKPAAIEYPFTRKELLLDIWSLDAKRFKNRPYVIGQDLGLMEPIKSPADALFSRAFLELGGKVVPMMLSGSGWTQSVYGVFHAVFARRLSPGDVILALGDDLNLKTASTTEEVFSPYIKVKSTDQDKNQKKILGQYTSFSLQEDPDGKETAYIGVVPRVLRTVSSATKIGGYWGEKLSRLPTSGKMSLIHPEETSLLIQRDMSLISPYLSWKGPRRQLLPNLQALWRHVPVEIWDKLKQHDEELEHRLSPEEDDAEDAVHFKLA